jgi:hypothetical protein
VKPSSDAPDSSIVHRSLARQDSSRSKKVCCVSEGARSSLLGPELIIPQHPGKTSQPGRTYPGPQHLELFVVNGRQNPTCLS